MSVALFALLSEAFGVTLVFPQNRTAYYVDEPIEIAVAGIADAQAVQVTLLPEDAAGGSTVKWTFVGDGRTRLFVLDPYTLAPGLYRIEVADHEHPQRLRISRGWRRSTLPMSQTLPSARLRDSGGMFGLVNGFNYGLLNRDGLPETRELRRRSPGLQGHETLIEMDLPSLIYMYWTGFVTHKPWGTQKSWASESMTENMRLFNFHVAQRLRRYERNILRVGSLDEPGLAWGRTPAGGSASGFPNWDEEAWYTARGFVPFTSDIASLGDEQWMQYMRIRCRIIREQNEQAKKDLKQVWPGVVFSTDFYAPGAIMDGTDPLSQQINDVVSTHVFADYGMGKLGVIGASYLEKAHHPTARVAHAMNGPLFGKRTPQPQLRNAFHLMASAMLAAGLESNWWLNTGEMTDEDLAAVNEPVMRVGPLFREMSSEGHDIAILWSFTELAMRQKAMAAKESDKKTGEQIKLMVSDLPENASVNEGELVANAYTVGNNYRDQVIAAHRALSSAGHPAHILHEAIVTPELLSRYKVLFITGQTFDLPRATKQAIETFVKTGGVIVIDDSTTASLPGTPVRTTATLKDFGLRWLALAMAPDAKFKSAREASVYKATTWAREMPVREMVKPISDAMKETPVRPVVTTDSAWLGIERHVAGEGQLVMVLNGYEQLPTIADQESHVLYNHAPTEATIRLNTVPPGGVVHEISGIDWRTVTRIDNPDAHRTVLFGAAETKLYLVAPRTPERLDLSATTEQGRVSVRVKLVGLKMPWPIELALVSPTGTPLAHVYRAVNADGTFEETIALGTNAPAGSYVVRVTSQLCELSAEARVEMSGAASPPREINETTRVFDAASIKKLLISGRPISIVSADMTYEPAALQLVEDLRSIGIDVDMAAEETVMRRVKYPRVWDPYPEVFRPTGQLASLPDVIRRDAEGRPIKDAAGKTETEPGKVLRELDITSTSYDTPAAVSPAGEPVSNWRRPGTLLNVVEGGFIDHWTGVERFFEPGCRLFVGDGGKLHAVDGSAHREQSTQPFRERWARPWTRLTPYVGTDRLVPHLPAAYAVDRDLILIGDSSGSSTLIQALQASELLPQVADRDYPGPGKCLVMYAWSPFSLGKDAVFIAAADIDGATSGVESLKRLLNGK